MNWETDCRLGGATPEPWGPGRAALGHCSSRGRPGHQLLSSLSTVLRRGGLCLQRPLLYPGSRGKPSRCSRLLLVQFLEMCSLLF